MFDPRERGMGNPFQEIVKCRRSFPYFCKNYVQIYHPLRGMVPFKLYDFQERTVDQYNVNRFIIIRKFRQGGLSTMTAIYILWKMLFFVDKSAFCVSITDREAMNFHRIIRLAFDNLPKWMAGEPTIANQHELVLETGGSVICTTPKAGRSFAKGLLVIDEAAFIPDMDKFWARVYPTVSTGGQVLAISTVNGVGNWYHQTWNDAENHVNKFHPIRLHYMEHPDYQNPEWVEDTKAQLGEKSWLQEVVGEFLGSADTYIPGPKVKEINEETVEPKEIKLDGALWIWEKSRKGHRYILGCDPSEGIGKDGDFSSIQVIDIKSLSQVAEFYSQDFPPSKFSQIVASLGLYYNGASVVVENNNMGVPVLDDLYSEIGYENIYFHVPVGTEKKPKKGFNTNVKTRPQVQEAIFHTLTNDLIKINSRRLATELQTWVFNPQTRKAHHLKNYHDDAIIALGFALVVREAILRDVPPWYDATDEDLEENTEMVSTYIKDKSLINEIVEDGDEGDDTDLNPLGPIFYNCRPDDEVLREFGW